ncbi:adenosylmethionine decarboxylase [Roseomonas alkaliterrae]|uniref:S-adenosylmethionine decarboxylase proenzyme n=1 Tax=Neoroseomonas alkaliterrae TaxID=1452450 RepID=A0A840XZ22_9PROT|nr:adenosylmethionine decarboxylase [Neoroseomonas alkaliterrae]MBB5691859.1 S-adenosylmethionine decarboxylase [Neoroseomonas alkaliterrae]MBR0678635.1 adenosylmethionine decarboxylase [Neoroseomonas alkaliterrae]
MEALVQPGMVSDMPSDTRNTDDNRSASPEKDYFVQRDGVRFAGTHLIIDLWGATNLDDPDHIDAVLREGALATGATILHGHFHHFSPNGGVSGVLVLAESHVSIHTWPERDYAAIDIFVCGECNPYKAIAALKRGFLPERVQLSEHKRGLIG